MSTQFARGSSSQIVADASSVLQGIVSAADPGSTVAILWRPLADTTDMGLLYDPTNFVLSVNPYLDNGLYFDTESGHFHNLRSYSTADNWVLDVICTRDDGAGHALTTLHTQHRDDMSWAASTERSTSMSVPGGPKWGNATAVIGRAFNASLTGRIAAVGIWDVYMNQTQARALAPGLSSWIAPSAPADPVVLWSLEDVPNHPERFDLLEVGAGIVSTTALTYSTDEPPNWSYALSTTVDLTGAADLRALTGSGTLTRRVKLDSSVSLGQLTSSGQLKRRVKLVGSSSLGQLTAAAALRRRVDLTGSASLGRLTASLRQQGAGVIVPGKLTARGSGAGLVARGGGDGLKARGGF